MYRGLRVLLLSYFISHIPITLLIDAQIVFGSLYPAPLQDVFTWYVSSFRDIVLRESGLWLKSFIYAEIIFQLPFFFYAVKALWNNTERDKTYSVYALAYGIHVANRAPYHEHNPFSDELGNERDRRLILIGIYAPYFLCPLLVAVEAAGNLVESNRNNVKKA